MNTQNTEVELMKDLNRLIEECKAEVEAVGIEIGNIYKVSVNNRAIKRWGRCRRSPYGTYEIEISYRLMGDDVDDKATKTTIIHELLHTVRGGNGHTGEWKRCANLMNKTYGYDIKRTTSCDEKGVAEVVSTIKRNGPKYRILCEHCGKVYNYYKRSKIINYFIESPYKANRDCKCGRCKINNTLHLVDKNEVLLSAR